MFNAKETRGHFEEGMGILLVTLGLLLGISLLTYSPNDPSLSSLSTERDVQNAVGTVGAYLSDLFLQGFGYAAFLFPLFLLGLGVHTLRRGEWFLTRNRMIGFFLFLFSTSGLMALDLRAGNTANLAGRSFAWLLTAGFARLGAHVILVSCFFISLMLVLNFSLRNTVSQAITWVRRAILWIQARIRIRRGQKRRERTRLRLESPSPVALPVLAAEPALPPEALQGKGTVFQENFDFMKGNGEYVFPTVHLLTSNRGTEKKLTTEELQRNAQILQKKLSDFDIKGQVTKYHPGPIVTLYEFEPAPGIKVNRIVTLSDDLALAMKALQVRIVAPIPGESAVGIEIPNPVREEVLFRDILESMEFSIASSQKPLPLALGKDIFGRPVVTDLADMPHLLVAGATGSGKSVALNSMILSVLFSASPERVRLLMIDPKRLELTQYEGIPHLLRPVVVQAREAAKALRKIVFEMEHRYQILAERGVRNIKDCNAKGSPLPYIVVIIDELADLMMVASRDVEESIGRLAQMARACGIHLILATQRPSVDVLTGVIKANFPARISFSVSSKTDSRTILDSNGAEQLLGKGDMLFLSPGSGRITRIHGSYVSEEDTRKVVNHVRTQKGPQFDMSESLEASSHSEGEAGERDELYQKSIDLVISTGQASASFIQRRMRVGYPRAARMVEMMEEDGIVGPASGAKPREILLNKEGIREQ